MRNSQVLLFSVLSLLTLNACTTLSAEKIVGPDGEMNTLVKCSNIEGCYAKARESCGGNYKILHSSNDTSGGVNGTAVTTTESILIKCVK